MAELRSRRYGINPFKVVLEHNCMRNNFVFLDLVGSGRATRYGGISSYLDADIHKVDI